MMKNIALQSSVTDTLQSSDASLAIINISQFPTNQSVITKLSDEGLLNLCREYGKNALLWRQKFMGLLPEVNRRRLYEKRGFGSIFEFAAKLAGASAEQVGRILNLDKKFGDKKILHELLINGEVSLNKLAKIASIATIENQECLADQVKILPCRALETLAKDERLSNRDSGFSKNLQVKSVHVNKDLQHTRLFVKDCENCIKSEKDSAEPVLSSEVKQRLFELQQKGIDINQLLTEFLDQREEKIEAEKEKLAKELIQKMKNASGSKSASRHIPVKVRKIIKQEHGTKCSISNCSKPAVDLHHTLRFAMSKNHNPHFIAPLCKDHHLIAHSIDRKFMEERQVALRR